MSIRIYCIWNPRATRTVQKWRAFIHTVGCRIVLCISSTVLDHLQLPRFLFFDFYCYKCDVD